MEKGHCYLSRTCALLRAVHHPGSRRVRTHQDSTLLQDVSRVMKRQEGGVVRHAGGGCWGHRLGLEGDGGDGGIDGEVVCGRTRSETLNKGRTRETARDPG